MATLLPIVPLLWALAALAPPDSQEDDAYRLLEDSSAWIVAIFPASLLPGASPDLTEESLRKRLMGQEAEVGAVGRKFIGTGIVVGDGEILTSNGVIPEGARKVGVRTQKGHASEAEVVARYERGGLALLKVPPEVLGREGSRGAPTLGRSADVRPGQRVFTIGNVFHSIGIDGTPAISRGVVSRVGRAEGEGRYRGEVIETDGAINPGSYGGPLLNLDGEVIGIIDLGYSHRRWIGQAIPIDVVKEVLPDLRKGWTPRHTLGMRTEDDEGAGVTITATDPEGPAGIAGLRQGDRIIRADGEEIASGRDLDGVAARLPIGTPIDLVVIRGGETIRVRLRVGKE